MLGSHALPPATRGSALYATVERLASSPRLDRFALPLAARFRQLPPGLAAALRGRWLGHALHPAATDWPHAAWLGASLLDLCAGASARPAAKRLVGAGLVTAVPAMVSGAADWSGSARTDRDRGGGLVHGAVLTAATGVYGCSYLARRRGHHNLGTALALIGGVATTVGDYVGGYLALGRGLGAAVTMKERGEDATSDVTPGNGLYPLGRRLEDERALDAPVRTLHTAAAGLIRPGPIKNSLTGTWLGHSLHPLLTDFPLGAWMSASLLDLVGGQRARKPTELLIAFGLFTAVPTAAAGASEWVDTDGRDRRVGLVHAGVNASAWLLYAASLTARRRRRVRLGMMLGAGGVVTATASAYLGGHLSLARSVGVSSVAGIDMPDEWTRAVRIEELHGAAMARAAVGEDGVLVAADGPQVHALAARCTHRGGPLDEGTLENGCITCPWHGSRFRITDGAVVRGPASVPEPAGEARRRDGWVEVRRHRPGGIGGGRASGWVSVPARPRNDPRQYDDLADEWWKPGGELAALHWLAAARAALVPSPPRPGALLVDVGCGGGVLAPHLSGYRHVGVDVTLSALRLAHAHGVVPVRADATRLPFDDGVADVVVAGELFEHLADVEGAVGEIARIMRRGGSVVFDTINDTRWARVSMVAVGERMPGGPPRNIHDPALFVPPERVVEAFAAHGVDVSLRGLRPSGVDYLRFLLDRSRRVRMLPTASLAGVYQGVGCKQ